MADVLQRFGDPAPTLRHLSEVCSQFEIGAQESDSRSLTLGSSGVSSYADDDLDEMDGAPCSYRDPRCLKEAKVLGVHKRERAKETYLFVIAVKWTDDSHLTIYRTLKEIKALQKDLLAESKRNGRKESKKYLSKLTRRVRDGNRIFNGTMERLRMIDNLNNYFEAVMYYPEFKQGLCVQAFFRPTAADLTSATWSGEGRTFFYVTRDILGQRNQMINESNPDNENESGGESVPPDTFSQFSMLMGPGEPPSDVDCSDPNISWPIQQVQFVARCDFQSSESDRKQNIISLREGDQVEVLSKYDSGWWLVKKPDDQTKVESNTECGYVPATYLIPNSFEAHKFENERESLTEEEGWDAESKQGVFENSVAPPSGAGITDFSRTSDCCSRCSEEDSSSTASHAPCKMDEDEVREPSQPNRRSLATVEELGDGDNDERPEFTLSTTDSDSSDSLSCQKQNHSPKRHSVLTIDAMEARRRGRKFSNRASCASAFSTLDHHGMPGDMDDRRFSLANFDTYQQQAKMRRNIGTSLPNIQRLSSFSGRSFMGSSTAFSVSPLSEKPVKSEEYLSNKKYEAIRRDELSFDENAVITVLSKNPDGWWRARYQGEEGLVPAVYLKRYHDPLRELGMHVLSLL